MSPNATAELDQLITENITKVLREGEPVYNQDGDHVANKTPSAAFITSAIKWRGVIARDGSAADKEMTRDEIWEMLHASRSEGDKLPHDEPEDL